MGRILIVDDDPDIREVLAIRAVRLGHEAEVATVLDDGLKAVATGTYDLVFLDVRLPDGNGLEAISTIKRAASRPEVVIITGVGDGQGAELAMTHGAWDYLQKPILKTDFELQVKRALDYRRKKTPVESVTHHFDRRRIIGNSTRMAHAINQAAQCAISDANVLVTGRTGTGKEVFAQAIHENSPRRKASFIVVDCAALPEHLVESVLFGHSKGAFTSADQSRTGLVKQADGGTLFLDEIGELPPAVQKSFLRVIQERKFRPVGADRELRSDFRLISATNRNLDQMANEGRFREDLLFRIKTVHIDLPDLNSRAKDINALILHYIHATCQRYGIDTKGFVPEFFEVLETYDWPGNVRELINVIENAIVDSGNDPVLYPANLPAHIRSSHIKRQLQDTASYSGNGMLPPFKEAIESAKTAAEESYLKRLMVQAAADIEDASRISRLSRSRLYALLKKYALTNR